MKELQDDRQYRAIGRFSAERVRELVPGPLDAIKLGCPPALFERVLERRAAFRNTSSDAARRRRLADSVARAAQQEAGIPPTSVTDAQRRVRLQTSLDKAHAQDVAAWQKGLL